MKEDNRREAEHFIRKHRVSIITIYTLLVLLSTVQSFRGQGGYHLNEVLNLSSIVIFSIHLFSEKIKNRMVYINLTILWLTLFAVLSMLFRFNSINGMVLLFIAAAIAFQYGYFDRFFKIKIWTLIIFSSLIMLRTKEIKSDIDIFSRTVSGILFLSLFFLIVYIIYQTEITAHRIMKIENAEKIKQLKEQRSQYLLQLDELNNRIEGCQRADESLNLSSLNLTISEINILTNYLTYRETNKDLGKRLHLSPFTVRNHLLNIQKKIGAKSKYEIAELCRKMNSKK